MEYRQLGKAGLHVPALSFGTATFGGGNEFFKAWGNTDVKGATKIIDICMDAGLNLFDTADTYSDGLAEEILGKAIAKKSRDSLLLSTKCTFPVGTPPNHQGSSRHRILKQVDASLKRLGTDYIDIYHMHGFDGNTAVEETLRTLDDLVQSGKVRYIAASNFSGWHLMKSLALSEKHSWHNYAAHQVYYSLANREYEWELMPLGVDQKIGALVWSPLSAGRLNGKYKTESSAPKLSRIAQGGSPVPATVIQELVLQQTLDALKTIADETNKTMAQVAINWLLQRPTVSSVILGARNQEQLLENLGSIGWNLTVDQIRFLDQASETTPIYPYWHQRNNTSLNPIPDFYRQR